jgi:hypothetical protein
MDRHEFRAGPEKGMPIIINLPTNIVDKAGSTFALESKIDSAHWALRILAPGTRREVGRANCVPGRKVLRLQDIHVDEAHREGMGSDLLKVIIDAARFHFRMIEGVIKAGDLEEYPDLPSWYEQNGFEVNRTITPMTFRQLIPSKPQPGAIAPTKEVMTGAAQEWARQHPFIQRVWLYGSRITGVSSNTKKPPAPDTDWDIAVEIDGESEYDRRTHWVAFMDQAVGEMQALTNWKIDVHHCDPRFDPERVAAEVMKGSILVYERDASS